jgi:PEP-CTERM motif
MNLRSCSMICTGILALFIASPAFANHVDRPASGHGTDDSCSTGDENCQTFGTAFTASDGLSVTPYTFSDDGSVTFNYLDLFAVTGVSSGTTISFTFPTLATPLDGQFGVFACNGTAENPGQAIDAAGVPFGPTPSPCTAIPPTQTASDFLSNPTGPVTTWTFNSSTIGTWWFYAVATGPTLAGESIYLPTSVTVTGGSNTVPEPGTLLLLASGLVGLAVLRRRQAHA